MRAIPASVLTLLKSKSMIGVNKPTYNAHIEGMKDRDFAFSSATTLYTPSPTDGARHPSAALLNNGKVLYVYSDGNNIKQGYANNVNSFFANDCLSDITTIFADVLNGVASVFRVGEELYLHIVWRGIVTRGASSVRIYHSPLGDGSDWTLYSTIRDYTLSGSDLGNEEYTMAGVPYITSSGRWIIASTYYWSSAGNNRKTYRIWTSDDNGQTWTARTEFGAGTLQGIHVRRFSRRFAKWESALYFFVGNSWGTSSNGRVYKSTDNGESWPHIYSWDDYNPYIGLFVSDGEKIYLINRRLDGDQRLWSTTTPDVKESWVSEDISWSVAGSDAMLQPLSNIQSALMFQHRLVGAESESSELIAKSISISRNKGMAANLDITFDNKDGILTPTKAGDWNKVIWPGNKISIKQGYGKEIETTFTGLIDAANCKSFPQEIETGARDKTKLLLDKTITSASGSHVLEYTDEPIEDIASALIALAGLTPGTIEQTGVNLTKTFAWESYMDALQHLADLVNFNIYADEDGLINFTYNTTRQPTDTDTIQFDDDPVDGIIWFELSEPVIVENSEKVHNTTTSTDMVKDTDYTIEYSPTARIKRIDTAGISDGDTCTVNFVYPAYTFREGEDIAFLGVRVDDSNLYYSVIVHGEDSSGNVIEVKVDWAGASEYNVPEHKILKINAYSADTNAKCTAIANRAIQNIKSSARLCSFASIGISWLQVGDCVRIVETSTDTDRIFTITDLRTSQSSDGYTMQIDAYELIYDEVS